MAWLTVAQSNEELVNKLINHQVLTDDKLIQAFRLTDRGDFVQETRRYYYNWIRDLFVIISVVLHNL
jgi:hypothetical protein